MSTVDDEDDGTDDDGLVASVKNRKKGKTLKWISIRFWSALLLLTFQLLLGCLTGAVSLLADSGRSAADVLLHGFNLWAEQAKVPGNANKLAMIGSLFSLVMLLSMTCFAALEAVTRLRVPLGRESGNIGHALLAYAVVRTAVSLGLFVMYRSWHGTDIIKTGGSNSILGGESVQRDGQVTQNLLNSPVTFGRETLATETLQWCPRCQKTSVDHVSELAGDEPSKTEDFVLALHMIIHPGCACSANIEEIWAGNRDVEACEVAAAMKSAAEEFFAATSRISRNLYFIATRLHLITDILRGATIFLVAVLIQLGAIQDAAHGDAVCGLVVACLILLGSTSLLLEVFAKLHACCKRNSSTMQSRLSKSNEKTRDVIWMRITSQGEQSRFLF